MFSLVFSYTIVFLMLLLAAAEFRRYRYARLGGESMEYPRERFTRRLMVAGLVIVVMLAVEWKPEAFSAYQNLMWYGACLVLVVIVIALTLRELHATSLAAVKEQERFRRETEAHLTQWGRDRSREGDRTKDPHKGV